MKSQSIKTIRANNTRALNQYPEAVKTLVELGIISHDDNNDHIAKVIKGLKSHQYGIKVKEGSDWVLYKSFVDYSQSIQDYQLRDKFEELVFDLMEENQTIKPQAFIYFEENTYTVTRADAKDFFALRGLLKEIPKE